MRAKHLTAFTLCAFASVTANAKTNVGPEQSYLAGYVGQFDVTQRDDVATQFGLEYRMKPVWYGIRPTIGANATSDGSFYGYAGINWDIELIHEKVFFTPNFMVGGYHDGGGKDLGGPIEFRSGLELSYQFNNQSRAGIAFNHISNASIYNHNPGSETLLVNYSVPLSFFGNW